MQSVFLSIPPQVFNYIGIVGFGVYVLAYQLLNTGRLDSKSDGYFWLNLLAASLVLIGLAHAFNLASALIQMFWIAISVHAIVSRQRRKALAKDDQRSQDFSQKWQPTNAKRRARKAGPKLAF